MMCSFHTLNKPFRKSINSNNESHSIQWYKMKQLNYILERVSKAINNNRANVFNSYWI